MIKNKKVLIISVVSLLFVALMASALIIPRLNRSTVPGEDSVPTDSNFVEDTNQPLTDGTTPKEDKVLTADQTPTSSSIEKPTITRAEQSGDYIRVSAILSTASNGSCILTATKSGSPNITKTTAITVGPSYYTCDGFRISKSEFSTGEWSVAVTHELNGKTATSDTKVINVN
jgi:hypothetical protein